MKKWIKKILGSWIMKIVNYEDGDILVVSMGHGAHFIHSLRRMGFTILYTVVEESDFTIIRRKELRMTMPHAVDSLKFMIKAKEPMTNPVNVPGGAE